MPIYQFRCPACRATREVTASIRDDVPRPTCCGGGMRRSYAVAGLLGRAPAATAPVTAHVDDHSLPGGCLLRPELRAAWSARNRADGAAVERSLATLEREGIRPPF